VALDTTVTGGREREACGDVAVHQEGTGMKLPGSRGPISEGVVSALRQPAGAQNPATSTPQHPTATPLRGDPWHDEDLQVALWTCYELHYRGFDDVDEEWEWDPALLRLRARLERRHEQGLVDRVARPDVSEPSDVPAAIARLVGADDGPSLGGHLLSEGTREQFRDMLVHRSVFHLKEADPHTWAIPRLAGAAKAALVEVQADEYGGGRPERVHQELFRIAMREFGLDDSYGAYVDDVPACTLAVNNTQSLFGLHRRWLGAIAGHLAAFEMTSSIPNRQFGRALRRLGVDGPATIFFDEHVEADSVHDQIAAHDLCGNLAIEQPQRTGDILFGAACSLAMDRLLAEHLLACWAQDTSSLRQPIADAA
jgi:hypothetical protein